MTTISTKYSKYINFIVEFIVIIVTNITLYNIFRYIESSFGVADTRKCANLDVHIEMPICMPNLEKHKCFINLSNAIDQFTINF